MQYLETEVCNEQFFLEFDFILIVDIYSTCLK